LGKILSQKEEKKKTKQTIALNKASCHLSEDCYRSGKIYSVFFKELVI